MSRYDALREGAAKVEYARHAAFGAIKPHLEKVIAAGESLAAKRAALAKDARLSDVGRAEQLRDIAALHAPAVAKTARMLKRARAANDEKETQARWFPTVQNPADVAEALIRQEYRALLRTKTPAEAIAIVFSGDGAAFTLIESRARSRRDALRRPGKTGRGIAQRRRGTHGWRGNGFCCWEEFSRRRSISLALLSTMHALA